MDLEKLKKNVTARGMEFFYARTAEEAKQHVLEQVRNTTVGIGGSKTVDALGLYDELCKTNEVHWHWKDGALPEVYRAAEQAEVYLSSVNGISETGELVNIDGRGNRVAALTYVVGKRVFLLASSKKRETGIPAGQLQKSLPGSQQCDGSGEKGSCSGKRAEAAGKPPMQHHRPVLGLPLSRPRLLRDAGHYVPAHGCREV